MARRFAREGHFEKNFLSYEKNGIRPFAQNLIWEAIGWHYKNYMGPTALHSMRSSQQNMKILQKFHSHIATGETLTYSTSPTKNFFFANFIPNNIPIRASTNPFCRYTQNSTGWQEVFKPRRPSPRPHRQHQIGGSNPKPVVKINLNR